MSSDLGTLVFVVDADEEAKPSIALVTDSAGSNADGTDLVNLLVLHRASDTTPHVMENVPLFDSEPDARQHVGHDTPWHACRKVNTPPATKTTKGKTA